MVKIKISVNVDTGVIKNDVEMNIGDIAYLRRNDPCSWGISTNGESAIKDYDVHCEEGEFGIKALARGTAVVYSAVGDNKEYHNISVY